MPQPRIPLEPGLMYHIWTHANGSENLFRSEENYKYFLKKYNHHVHPVAETFAYCLMPNHLHLMIRDTGEGGGGVINPSRVPNPGRVGNEQGHKP